MTRLTRACILTISVAGLVEGASAQELRVGAASDLQSVLPAIAASFERTSGLKVALTFASSGSLFAQIQNGAPFDVFLSADVVYPQQLEQAGLAERGSVYQYAVGRIVLWTRTDSGVDVRKGLAVLLTPAVRRIAIANPEHAPYGRAAVAALRHEQLYDRVREKFVLGENISQTAQFGQSGNADVAILSLSLTSTPALKTSGTFVEIPESFHPPIIQAAAVISRSRQKDVARRFVDYLKTPGVLQVLASHGFGMPRPATAR